ncbi:hypothetical protein B0G82_7453 [Paraburkholderia sp. BL17N1]|nr:hypothetical protein B0G82_7453 [Paraburkholderia sp. BL17N1]
MPILRMHVITVSSANKKTKPHSYLKNDDQTCLHNLITT